MAHTITQLVAVSYPAVLAEKRRPENQWAESSFLREMERQGMVERRSLGATIQFPLDYQRNQGGDFLATDLAATSLSKPDVITAADYSVAELSVPVVWSKKDEATNPSENQKVAFVASLLSNAIETHDDLIEDKIFETTTSGFLGLLTHVPTSGQGSSGGISGVDHTFWRNQFSAYVDDTDIESAFTTIWNNCSKGSGSKLAPTLMTGAAATQSLFEGTQQANQRYVDSQELKAGFKVLSFKTSRFVFSQYQAADTVYFLNPKNFKLVVSKQYFRDRGDTQEIPNANGFVTKIYSALQSCTNNKSRLGVAYV